MKNIEPSCHFNLSFAGEYILYNFPIYLVEFVAVGQLPAIAATGEMKLVK